MPEGPARRLCIHERFEKTDGPEIEMGEMAECVGERLPRFEGVSIERRDPIDSRDRIQGRGPIQNRGQRARRAAKAEREQNLVVASPLCRVEQHFDESFGTRRANPRSGVLGHPLEIAGANQSFRLGDGEHLRHSHALHREQEEHEDRKNMNRSGSRPRTTNQITTSNSPRGRAAASQPTPHSSKSNR